MTALLSRSICRVRERAGKSFELWFNKENFCHLLGLETIAKNSVPYKKLHKYTEIDGLHNIYGENEDGSILGIPHIKTSNKKMFYSKVKNDYVIIHLVKQEEIEITVLDRTIML